MIFDSLKNCSINYFVNQHFFKYAISRATTYSYRKIFYETLSFQRNRNSRRNFMSYKSSTASNLGIIRRDKITNITRTIVAILKQIE